MTFEELYRDYQLPIYKFLLNRVKSPEMAEDLTQDVFERALKALGRVHNGNYKTWLFTIAHHLFLDVVRHNRLVIWCALPDEKEDQYLMFGVDSHEDTTIRRLDLEHDLRYLTPSERTGLLLWMEGGSAPYVKQQAHRARRVLAEVERNGGMQMAGKKRKRHIS